MNQKRSVGKLGEKLLSLWASQEPNVTVNRAFEDEKGWDFLIEFPARLNENGNSKPLDKRPYLYRCMIQVKSTDLRPKSWPVKLDNWERLIKHPLPAFFLVCMFGGINECEEAYLVHIDESYIRQGLMKLREVGLDQEKALHKVSLRFNYKKSDRLSSLNGKGLLEAIVESVGSEPEKYSSKKIEIVNSVGYEDSGYLINSNIIIPEEYRNDPLMYLIDFSIGQLPKLEATQTEFLDNRFGITASEPYEVMSEGFIELVNYKPSGKGTLIFSIDNSNQVQIDVEIFIPRGFSFRLESRYQKIRFASPFFELVSQPYGAGTSKLILSVPKLDVKYPLKDLQPMSELVMLIYSAFKGNQHLKIDIMLNDKRAILGRLPAPELKEAFLEIASVIKWARIISKRFDLEDKIEIRIIDLLDQRSSLQFLAFLIYGVPFEMRIVYNSSDELVENNTKTCVPLVSSVSIGIYKFVLGVIVEGYTKILPEVIDQEYNCKFFTEKIYIFQERIVETEEENLQESVKLFEIMCHQFRNTHFVLIRDGLNAHLYKE